MSPSKQAFLDLIHQEVVPALGCTEPIAVALTAAKAAETLGTVPERLCVEVSANLLKNGMGVMVPGTGEMGLNIAGGGRARWAAQGAALGPGQMPAGPDARPGGRGRGHAQGRTGGIEAAGQRSVAVLHGGAAAAARGIRPRPSCGTATPISPESGATVS